MKTKISKIIRRIAVFFAVFFAAGLFNISANAQYVSEATADVYQRPTFIRTFGANNIDFSDPILTIIESIRTASQANFGNDFELAASVIGRSNDDDAGTIAADENLGSTNLLQFGGREMALGDRFRLISSGVPVATVYFYTTGSEMAFAENTGNQKAAADLVSGEFFLNTVSWAETTDITAAGGFTPVQCATNYERQSDMTSCACPANLPVEQGGMCVAATPTLTCDAASTTGQNGDECTCRDGYTQRISPEMCAMPQTGNNNPSTGNNTQTSGGESESKAAKVIGVVGIGMAIYVIANGGLFSDAFAFSPDFGYSLTESGYAANAGGRIDFRKDNWHLYQSATQTNNNGQFADFRYTSGGKYTADIWTATFSESISGETADYNFSLSAADFAKYRLHSRFDKGETETRNELFMQKQFRHNRWTINPSAGFQWRHFGEFADNARFRIDAVHRF